MITASAQAEGQSLLVKNSAQSTLPIISEVGPPRSSGITYSPIAGINTRLAPATSPGSDIGTVILQKTDVGLQPRSKAASRRDRSIFSSDTYAGNIMNGR
ncbi:hypothetical protein HYD_6610 [Candidatus Hydrogenosomobacter endosymbioticus]|uniref:Uncharacterized protein n=1 Tax=Candidatus Hydrogenosomobacter endosymbioticus TaxID=2558174 RepID=A0ABM7V9Q9_9PROT|nr:hypothetical protein HYD_6610 [Candidatus Hydrogenosomobacter endosymbioticus]